MKMANRIILNRGESNCCSASVYENTDRCTECGENCEVIEYEDN